MPPCVERAGLNLAKAAGLNYDGTDETTKLNSILAGMSSVSVNSRYGAPCGATPRSTCRSPRSAQVRQASIRITGGSVQYGPGSTFTGGTPYPTASGLDLH